MEETVPQISVVICTRNRGASIVQTLESVFANKHPSFEVIVVDQSTNDETKQAIAPYQQDPCFHYICSDTIGTGRSRNIGLHAARGEIVAYTDDDCIVPVDWLEQLEPFFSTTRELQSGFAVYYLVPMTIKSGQSPIINIHATELFAG